MFAIHVHCLLSVTCISSAQEGNSAVMLAAKEGHLPVFRVLVTKYGCSVRDTRNVKHCSVCVHTSISLYIHQSVHPSVCTSISLYIYQSVNPSVCTSISLYIHTSICTHIHQSVPISISLYVYPSVNCGPNGVLIVEVPLCRTVYCGPNGVLIVEASLYH